MIYAILKGKLGYLKRVYLRYEKVPSLVYNLKVLKLIMMLRGKLFFKVTGKSL